MIKHITSSLLTFRITRRKPATVRSPGTRNFFLSILGTFDFSSFSHIIGMRSGYLDRIRSVNSKMYKGQQRCGARMDSRDSLRRFSTANCCLKLGILIKIFVQIDYSIIRRVVVVSVTLNKVVIFQTLRIHRKIRSVRNNRREEDTRTMQQTCMVVRVYFLANIEMAHFLRRTELEDQNDCSKAAAARLFSGRGLCAVPLHSENHRQERSGCNRCLAQACIRTRQSERPHIRRFIAGTFVP